MICSTKPSHLHVANEADSHVLLSSVQQEKKNQVAPKYLVILCLLKKVMRSNSAKRENSDYFVINKTQKF